MKRLLGVIAGVEALVIVYLLMTGSSGDSPPDRPPSETRAESERIDPLPDPEPDAESASPAESGPDLELTLLYGQAIDGSGGAAENAWISITTPGGETRNARTGARGGYACAELGPGRHEVRVRATGFLPLAETVEIPAGVPVLRHDLELQRAIVVAIRLLAPNGKPLTEELMARAKERDINPHALVGGLSAVATREAPDVIPLTMSRTISQTEVGQYKPERAFGGGAPADGRHGTLEILGDLPVHVTACLRSEILTTVRLDAPQERLDLTIDPDDVLARLSGLTFRVLSTTGEVPEKISVDLSDRQSAGSRQAKPDEEGRIHIADQPPGELQLSIYAEGYRYYRVVDLPPGETLDLGTIRLASPVALTGKVVGPDGEPVTGAELDFFDADRPWDEQRYPPMTIRTGAEGEFRASVGALRFWIVASARDGPTGVAEVDLRASVPESVVIRMPICAPLTVDIRKSGLPVSFRVIDRAGHVLYGRSLTVPWKYTIRVMPGRYRVVGTTRGRPDVEKQVDLSADGATVVLD